MCNIYNEIKKSTEFNYVSSYYLFIGLKPYCDNKRESEQLVFEKYQNTAYQNTLGKVAFIPKEHSYPSSFLYLMKLIFNSLDFAEKLEKKEISNEELTIYLYNKGYVFVNIRDIENCDDLIEKAKHIIFIGCSNDVKCEEITKLIKDKSKGATRLYHSSGNNVDRKRHTEEWIKHDSTNSESINGEKINLTELILK